MSSAMDRAKGRIKEITGRISGNERLETEGRTDQTKARAREALKDVRERARGVRDSLRRGRS
ncbi:MULTISPECIES: CsbD family protein [unclassified Streptomyces]|uniref:CsbD family protein n=1 Tax=unclassified Streptomyces TaxID=2593676 RepID=UPI0035DBB8EE